ncbi:MAG: LamG domain-containing protein [Candidatus Aenigmatarchaeota archaeon]
MDIDFVISFGMFLILLSVILGLYFTFQSSTLQLTKSLELREKVIDFLTSLITKKGSPENWEQQGTIESLGLASEIFGRQVLVTETSGYSRINEPVAFFLDDLDINCNNKTFKNSVRVYEENLEIPQRVSNITYCPGNYLKNAMITFLVNISSSQSKSYKIYYFPFNLTGKNYTINLQAWYKFDEATGTTAYDYSGNENNGILNSNVSWALGKFSNSTLFNGSLGYVNVTDSNSLDLKSKFTISLWLNFTNDTLIRRPLCKYNAYCITKNADGSIAAHVWQGGVKKDSTTSSPLTFNSWHHIAITYNGSLLRLFVDGNEVTPATSLTGDIDTNNNHLYIGTDFDWEKRNWNGTIDDVRIYSIDLSPNEISTLFNSTPLNLKLFPEEKISALSPEKLNALKKKNYEELKKEIGEDFNFLIQISESR